LFVSYIEYNRVSLPGTDFYKVLIRHLNVAHVGVPDDLNEVEVSFKENPGHLRINF